MEIHCSNLDCIYIEDIDDNNVGYCSKILIEIDRNGSCLGADDKPLNKYKPQDLKIKNPSMGQCTKCGAISAPGMHICDR